MKLTKSQLKRIIKEEFGASLHMTNGIRDAIITHMESEGFFDMGSVPQSVIRVIENASLHVTRAIEKEQG